MGIDLGTANTLIYTPKKGIVLNEPSMITYSQNSVKEVGLAAKEIAGKHNDEYETIRPLRDGVIAEFTAAEDMIQEFIKKSEIPRLLLNHIVCGVPTGITQVEQRAVIDTIERAGARQVSLVAEPMAAAIGVGLDVLKPKASMVVDIGGGTTDIAVIAYGGIVVDNTIKVAGDELTMSIVHYLKNTHNLLIGEQTAEQLKINFGSALSQRVNRKLNIKGRDLILGQPKIVEMPVNEIYYAMDYVINSIVTAVKITIERTPPDLVSDLIDFGVVLTGGGALIKGLDQRISKGINLPVHVADNPLLSVVNGTKRIIESYDQIKTVLLRR
ncbi:MAG: rod shape-determining protein [Calditrichaeota bacterium]|nr:rod shape-determining protein [Calditrichota bacterium]